MQIVDSRRLSAGENRWLRDLSDKLGVPEIRKITEAIQEEGKYGRVRAYLEAIYRANVERMEEAFKMSDTALTLDKVLENIGLTDIWEKRGEEKKALEIAQNLF
jgi:hypothetical protein